jgi:hypothetical protein
MRFLVAISEFVPVFNGVWEDVVLIIAGILGTALIMKRESIIKERA